jgi:ABC-type uncharacterized transport system involved in gliding motility, auxiliary component
MANDPNKPSFSPAQRWGIGFNVVLATVVVLALVVMANYLASRYFKRVHLSSNSKVQLSSRTEKFVRSITNDVQITVYYDRDEPMYGDVMELLKEYRSTNPKLALRTVDYYRDPGTAQEIKAKYNLGASTNNNFVIFDCEGRSKIVDSKILTQYTLEAVEGSTEREFRRKPVAFNGEMLFTGALLSVINPTPLKAYYVEGHGEHSLTDASEAGYQTFASVLRQNYIDIQPLSLTGTNEVPMDCNLLIVAGPTTALLDFEIAKVSKYLSEGGRLFALFDARSAAKPSGLEEALLPWGVHVGSDLVIDPAALDPATGKNLVVSAFSLHPALNPAVGSGLYMLVPRPVSYVTNTVENPDVKVEPVAFCRDAYLYSDKSQKTALRSVMVAVDATVKGPIRERGATRMLVVGDSFLLNNRNIELVANRDFLHGAVNWLGERNFLLEGVGPKPVTEFRLVVTQSKMRTLQWILLGAVPGGILLFGGVIWLVRRK